MPVIEVHYKVTVDDKEMDRLGRIAKELGFDYKDSGPLLTASRLLTSEGIDGSFPNEHRLGLKVETIQH